MASIQLFFGTIQRVLFCFLKFVCAKYFYLQFSKLLQDWESLFMYVADPISLQNPGDRQQTQKELYDYFSYLNPLIPTARIDPTPRIVQFINLYETKVDLQSSNRNCSKRKNVNAKTAPQPCNKLCRFILTELSAWCMSWMRHCQSLQWDFLPGPCTTYYQMNTDKCTQTAHKEQIDCKLALVC